ncbi:hypothetical protein GGE65_001899 [Skermanella aerolata]|uniref:hypothetical protein n=1 Tax=Skermanella aerolata TaxID=393310 RepID=UPI003D1DB480
MSIDTLTADTSISRASPQIAKKNWETPIPNGIQENEVPDTGTVDMDFWDFVDIVNPLQHIPVVNTIYRELTGDSIKGVSRIIGGGIYGGVIGLVAGIGSAIVAETTGKDPGEHVLAMFKDSDGAVPQMTGDTAVADAMPSSAGPAGSAAAAVPATPASPAAAAQTVPASAPAPTTVAMAEPAAAGDVLMPAARTAAPVQRRLGDPEPARSFPVPKRTAGLLPRPVPVATGPAANIDKTPVQRAAAHLASERASAKPTASQAQPQTEARILPANQTQTAAWPPSGPAPVPPELVADMMMNALDKYKQGARTGTASLSNGAGVAAARGAF